MVQTKPRKSHIPVFPAKKIQTAVRSIAWKRIHDFAEEERDFFRDRILSQDFESFQVVFYPESGTNLSPQWLLRKEKAGADLRTMLATGHYLRSIEVFTRRDGTGLGLIRVGFHPRIQARNLKNETVPVLLNTVARVHEFGSAARNIPARPHWRPHLQGMKQRSKMVRKDVAREIVAELRKLI